MNINSNDKDGTFPFSRENKKNFYDNQTSYMNNHFAPYSFSRTGEDTGRYSNEYEQSFQSNLRRYRNARTASRRTTNTSSLNESIFSIPLILPPPKVAGHQIIRKQQNFGTSEEIGFKGNTSEEKISTLVEHFSSMLEESPSIVHEESSSDENEAFAYEESSSSSDDFSFHPEESSSKDGYSYTHEESSSEVDHTYSHEESSSEVDHTYSHEESSSEDDYTFTHEESSSEDDYAFAHEESSSEDDYAFAHEESSSEEDAFTHEESSSEGDYTFTHEESSSEDDYAFAHEESSSEVDYIYSHEESSSEDDYAFAHEESSSEDDYAFAHEESSSEDNYAFAHEESSSEEDAFTHEESSSEEDYAFAHEESSSEEDAFTHEESSSYQNEFSHLLGEAYSCEDESSSILEESSSISECDVSALKCEDLLDDDSMEEISEHCSPRQRLPIVKLPVIVAEVNIDINIFDSIDLMWSLEKITKIDWALSSLQCEVPLPSNTLFLKGLFIADIEYVMKGSQTLHTIKIPVPWIKTTNLTWLYPPVLPSSSQKEFMFQSHNACETSAQYEHYHLCAEEIKHHLRHINFIWNNDVSKHSDSQKLHLQGRAKLCIDLLQNQYVDLESTSIFF